MPYHTLILLIFNCLLGIINICGGDKMMHGKYTKSISDYYLSIPHKLTRSGQFATFKLPSYFEYKIEVERKSKKRNIRDNHEEKVHYGIPIDDVLYHAELQPNRKFIDSNLIIERRNPTIPINKRQLQGIENKKLCYYTGRIRGHPDSRVVLSTCDGLMGSVRINNKKYHIEPVDKHKDNNKGQLLHIVYSPDFEINVCGGSKFEATRQQIQKHSRYKIDADKTHRKRHVFSSKQKYIETLVVADKAFLTYYANKDWDVYILNAMNMAADIYHDASVGNPIDLILVRVIYLEKEEEEIDLQITKNVGETLASFGKWAEKINTPIDSPNHHDLAVLITRIDVCNEDGCGNTGLATFLGICKVNVSAGVVEDRGLSIAHVLAHEIGHTLGCDHDSLANNCSKLAPDGSSYVMATGSTLNAHSWSPCSREAITKTLLGTVVKCLDDRPTSEMYHYTNQMPGILYTSDEQCAFSLRGSRGMCSPKIENICKSMLCYTSAKKCVGPFPEAAAGTHCGTKKWCFNGECIEIGERPKAINGGWSDWSEWSQCSRTCGGGISYQERICNNPAPLNGGRFCLGDKMKVKLCNTHSCGDNVPTFREIQCAEENDRFEFNGKYSKWTPIPIENEERACSLICKNEDGKTVLLQPLVKDGTLCRPGTRDICINGECTEVGCDYQLNSGAVEDRCGVCNGDGTQCKHTKNTFNEPGKGAFLKTVVSIPAGARKIRIVEEADSPNHISVQDPTKKTFFLNKDGKGASYPGELTIAGSKALYKKLPKDKEELLIEGPIKQDILILYSYFQQTNKGVTYEWAESEVDNTYEPKYSWEIEEYSQCDVECGGGIQEPNWMCIEQKSGKVSTSFCSGLEKPNAENSIKKCNQQPCKTKWKVGPWSKCKACKNKSGVRIRVVQCVKENPRRNADDIIEENSECKELKPGSIELCEASHKCSRRKRSYLHIPQKHQENLWKQMHLIFERDCRIINEDFDDFNTTKTTTEHEMLTNKNASQQQTLNRTETTVNEGSSSPESTSATSVNKEENINTSINSEQTVVTTATEIEETEEIDVFETSSEHETTENASEMGGVSETQFEHRFSESTSEESSVSETFSEHITSVNTVEESSVSEGSSIHMPSENTVEESSVSEASSAHITSENMAEESSVSETFSEHRTSENTAEESSVTETFSEHITSENTAEESSVSEASSVHMPSENTGEESSVSEASSAHITSENTAEESSVSEASSVHMPSENTVEESSVSEASSAHITSENTAEESSVSEAFSEHRTSENTAEESSVSETFSEHITSENTVEESSVSEASSAHITSENTAEESSVTETFSEHITSENTAEESSVSEASSVHMPSENTVEESSVSEASSAHITSENMAEESSVSETFSEHITSENTVEESSVSEASSTHITAENTAEENSVSEASSVLITSEYTAEPSSVSETSSVLITVEHTAEVSSVSEASSAHITSEKTTVENKASEAPSEHITSESTLARVSGTYSENETSENTSKQISVSETLSEHETSENTLKKTSISGTASEYEFPNNMTQETSTFESSSEHEISKISSEAAVSSTEFKTNLSEKVSTESISEHTVSFHGTMSEENLSHETTNSKENTTQKSVSVSLSAATGTSTVVSIISTIEIGSEKTASNDISKIASYNNITSEAGLTTMMLSEKPLLALISDVTLNDTICEECGNDENNAGHSETPLNQVTASETSFSELISKAIQNKTVSEALSSKSVSDMTSTESSNKGESSSIGAELNFKPVSFGIIDSELFDPDTGLNGIDSKESLKELISDSQINDLIPQTVHKIVPRFNNAPSQASVDKTNQLKPSNEKLLHSDEMGGKSHKCQSIDFDKSLNENKNPPKASNQESNVNAQLSSTESNVIRDYIPIDQLELVFIDQIMSPDNLSDDAFARFGQENVEGVELSTLKVTGKQFIEYEQRLIGITNEMIATTKKNKKNREIVLLDYY